MRFLTKEIKVRPMKRYKFGRYPLEITIAIVYRIFVTAGRIQQEEQ